MKVYIRALALGAALAFGGGAWAQDGFPPSSVPLSRMQAPALPGMGNTNPYSNQDPTIVTRAEMERAFVSLRTEINTHFDAIEKAVDLAHQDNVRVPTLVDRAVSAEAELRKAEISIASEMINAKLEDISGKLAKLDIQFQERTAASSTAIAAALQAAKEAVGQQTLSSASAIDKAQAQTIEQLSQLRTLSSSEITSAAAQINDLKSRLDKQEGPILQSQAVVAGIEAQLIDMKSRIDKNEGTDKGVGQTYNWLFLAIGAGGVLVAIFAVFRNPPPRSYYGPRDQPPSA